MDNEQIAKIAEWMGLEDAHWDGDRVVYTTYYKGLPNVNEFDPINDGADAWRVLEHATNTRIEICENGTLVCLGAQAMAGADTPAEALCLAVLEMIDGR